MGNMNAGLNATVSGSFRRTMREVRESVELLVDLGCTVLSPADPRVVDAFGDFLYVASDRLRNIRLVQERHFAAIDQSDFLWLVVRDGYVGTSSALEIGWAARAGIPVYCSEAPDDWTLRALVQVVANEAEAIARVTSRAPVAAISILLDPRSVAERAHRTIDALSAGLLVPSDPADPVEALDAANELASIVRRVAPVER